MSLHMLCSSPFAVRNTSLSAGKLRISGVDVSAFPLDLCCRQCPPPSNEGAVEIDGGYSAIESLFLHLLKASTADVHGQIIEALQ